MFIDLESPEKKKTVVYLEKQRSKTNFYQCKSNWYKEFSQNFSAFLFEKLRNSCFPILFYRQTDSHADISNHRVVSQHKGPLRKDEQV